MTVLVPSDLVQRLEAIEAAVFDIQGKVDDVHAVFQGLQSVLPGMLPGAGVGADVFALHPLNAG